MDQPVRLHRSQTAVAVTCIMTASAGSGEALVHGARQTAVVAEWARLEEVEPLRRRDVKG